ncbi:MAG: hypothetical protein PVH83_11160 [Methyloceanibacter sp.]|jgi:hypothetical protein
MSKQFEWVPIVAIWIAMVAFCFLIASNNPTVVRGLSYDPDAELQSTPPLKPRPPSGKTKK